MADESLIAERRRLPLPPTRQEEAMDALTRNYPLVRATSVREGSKQVSGYLKSIDDDSIVISVMYQHLNALLYHLLKVCKLKKLQKVIS